MAGETSTAKFNFEAIKAALCGMQEPERDFLASINKIDELINVFMNVGDVQTVIEGISNGKTGSSLVFTEGIFCGALVYIAVYCFKNFQNYAMKIIGIITAVTLFVYCGFQHCVANMFYFGMAFNWNLNMLWNLLIVILTNSIGALLVRCLVHLAAIISTPKEKKEDEK